VPLPNRLRDALVDPACVAGWSPADWGLAIRQARSANLTAALAQRFEGASGPLHPPAAALEHFAAAQNNIRQRNATVLWETAQIRDDLASAGITPLFLKGAAYVAAGLPVSRHRNFSDIDLMVPHAQLGYAERALMVAGWLPTNRDPYDQRYYRKWMHEIPPLQHVRRGTTIDLHHAISPPVAKYRARMPRLFEAQVSACEVPGVSVLSPTDMILHAATHLFAEGEVENALRNLLDISELLRHFRKQSGFDARLVARADEVDLARPLFYAVRYIDRILAHEDLAELTASLRAKGPSPRAAHAMDAIYDKVFQGHHPSVWAPGTQWARSALYLRGHWLRMPLHLLLPHLVTKSFKSAGKKPDGTPVPTAAGKAAP
jgi:Uncharacterised nucleotidyltransferase